MGLIKAAVGAVGGTLADQWKEFYYCDSMPADVLITKGQKRVSGRSSNVRGEQNIITTGSGIAVADGQAMMIVEQGKVLDFSAEPGLYTFDISGEPSLFAGGGFTENAKASLRSAWDRFKYGGIPGKDTRIYYFNIKELVGNKYGTPNPVPFRVVDRNIGLDIDISIRCFGEYSYQISNPILFYTNVAGNVSEHYTRSELDSQLKSELLTALQPAFAKISAMGIRYSALPGHTTELAEVLNEVLSDKWRDLRGIEIVSLGVSSVKANEEDEQMIKELQKSAVMRDPTMAGATLVAAQADAMRGAASNEGGALTGFLGLGMAQQAGGGATAAQTLLAMGQGSQGQSGPASETMPIGWACPKCKQEGNTGKFCGECGEPRPADGWTCSCGQLNKGKFCSECGKAKPAGTPNYKCDKCGFEPEDPLNPPKFCPECGDRFDEEDQV